MFNVFKTDTGKEAKRCWNCYNKDRLRVRTNRDYTSYEKNDRDYAKRLTWKQNNHDTYSNYSIKSRSKKYEELGEEEYNRLNTQSHNNWYQNQSDEKKADMIVTNRNNPNYRLSTLKSSADTRTKKSQETENPREIKWDLTDDYALSLINSLCTYCGGKTDGACNSIDRIDNTKGYEMGNVCSCCDMCNYMKSNSTLEDFFQSIINILLHLKVIQSDNQKFTFKQIDNDTMYNYSYKFWCKKQINRIREVAITSDAYYSLIQGVCYLCGYIPIKKIGIDRIDNTKEYEIDNCRSCCKICNYMKNNYEYNVFVNKIIDIFNHSIMN